MKLKLHFLEAEGSLAPWRKTLSRQTTDVARRISEIVPSRLSAHSVDVAVQYFPDATIPELGFGGSCFSRSLVTISLNPDLPCFVDHLRNGEFASTLAHELHHAMRWRACGYGSTLGAALVSEGLADIFAESVTEMPTPPWADAIADTDWIGVLTRAYSEIHHEDYNHAAWFFGAGELPRWAGYTIGYRLVRLYRQLYPEAATQGMIDTAASAVLQEWDRLLDAPHG